MLRLSQPLSLILNMRDTSFLSSFYARIYKRSAAAINHMIQRVTCTACTESSLRTGATRKLIFGGLPRASRETFAAFTWCNRESCAKILEQRKQEIWMYAWMHSAGRVIACVPETASARLRELSDG